MKKLMLIALLLVLSTSCTKGYLSCYWDEGAASQIAEFGIGNIDTATYEKDIQYRWKRYYTSSNRDEVYLDLSHDCKLHVQDRANVNRRLYYTDLEYGIKDFPGQE